jgi:hypothetical protein
MWDRMSPEKLARAKGTDEASALAHIASGYGTGGQSATAAERRAAEALLLDKVSPREAKRLMKAATRKVRDTF